MSPGLTDLISQLSILILTLVDKRYERGVQRGRRGFAVAAHPRLLRHGQGERCGAGGRGTLLPQQLPSARHTRTQEGSIDNPFLHNATKDDLDQLKMISS